MKYKTFLLPLFIATIVFIAYIPALQNDFVNWDDGRYVYENQKIQTIDIHFFRWAFSSFYFSNWHPLTLISHALDYAMWGLDPWGHHLTNVIIHTSNTILVFFLVSRLIKCSTSCTNGNLRPHGGLDGKEILVVSGITALLFGIHPLHVESVAWISERKDLLYSFFYLLSLMAYIKYASRSRPSRFIYYMASLITFIFALMSKPMAVSLPLVLLMFDFYPLGRLTVRGIVPTTRRLLIEKAPFFLLSIFSSLVTVVANYRGGGIATLTDIPLGTRFFVSVHSYILYIIKMVFPFNLAPLYPIDIGINPFEFKYLFSLILLLSLTYLCISQVKRNRLFLSCLLYYVFTLAPVIGLVRVGGNVAADRYTYLPSLAPFLIAGLGVVCLYKMFRHRFRSLLAGALMIVLVIFIGITTRQIRVWKDSVALWSREIKLFPYFTVGYVNRGGSYYHSGNYIKAIRDYSNAVLLDPTLAEAYHNLGSAYYMTGNVEMARKYDEKAASLKLKKKVY